MKHNCENCKYVYMEAYEEPCTDCADCDLFEPMDNDAVDHPSHYNHGMECIEEMRHVFGDEAVKTFCLLNVWKYRKRALYKNGQEDMDKADWYMNTLVEL